ncbi:hypothetical protein NPIL_10921, partial [Nephila pilipes]
RWGGPPPKWLISGHGQLCAHVLWQVVQLDDTKRHCSIKPVVHYMKNGPTGICD